MGTEGVGNKNADAFMMFDPIRPSEYHVASHLGNERRSALLYLPFKEVLGCLNREVKGAPISAVQGRNGAGSWAGDANTAREYPLESLEYDSFALHIREGPAGQPSARVHTSMHSRFKGEFYSTVTLLARFLGWSTWQPRITAM